MGKKNMSQKVCLAIGAAALIGATANAEIITFEGLDNGLAVEQAGTPFVNLSNGITSTGANAGAAIFDTTTGVNAADPDLWVDMGNALILQNSFSSQTGDIFNNPNDDADGGTLIFEFDAPVEMLSMLLIDINGDTDQSATITLYDSNGGWREYVAPNEWTGDISTSEPGFGTIDLTTLAPQAGYLSSTTVTDNGLDSLDVVMMTVEFGASGGLDNVAFNIIPAPGAFALLGLGLVSNRRRRR
jgi:hypothetical protein